MKPMQPAEYSEALARLGFSNRNFCQVIDVNERTGRDWVAGETRIPGSVAALLRLALALDLSSEQLREILAKPPARQRKQN